MATANCLALPAAGGDLDVYLFIYFTLGSHKLPVSVCGHFLYDIHIFSHLGHMFKLL